MASDNKKTKTNKHQQQYHMFIIDTSNLSLVALFFLFFWLKFTVLLQAF